MAKANYFVAAKKHVKRVGKIIAEFIELLHELEVDMDSISIAGHSLGAHIAGYAGESTFKKFGTKISTIFGLGILKFKINKFSLFCFTV